MTPNVEAAKTLRKSLKVPAVGLEVWRSLYDNALRFMQLRPWEKLSDSDVFGIRDPFTGQIGYGCALGALGEVFALCIYRGSDGFDFYRRLQEGEIDPEGDDLLGVQNCLVGELEDRAALGKEDLSVIKALGLKLKGRKAYPVFRSHMPGYWPWYLTEEEAGFLAQAFAAAIDFHGRFLTKPGSVERRSDGSYLVYLSGSETTPSSSWTTVWLQPEPIPKARIEHPLLSAETLDDLLSEKLTPTDSWEVGSFIMRGARITDGERPYFPRVLLVLQASSGIVLSANAIPAFADEGLGLRDLVISVIRKFHLLPSEIKVIKAEIAEALKPLTNRLGIRLMVGKNLPALSQARGSFPEQ